MKNKFFCLDKLEFVSEPTNYYIQVNTCKDTKEECLVLIDIDNELTLHLHNEDSDEKVVAMFKENDVQFAHNLDFTNVDNSHYIEQINEKYNLI